MPDVEQVIMKGMDELLQEKSIVKKIDPNWALVDELGFTSMDISRLIARFDIELNLEPFAEQYSITDIRTVADLINAYR